MTNYDASSIDWQHWKRLDRWTLGQAILLSVGINPDDSSLAGKSRAPTDDECRAIEEAKRIEKYAWASYKEHKLMMRTSEWEASTVTPAEWVRWARTKGLRTPPEFEGIDNVAARTAPMVDYVSFKKRELWTLVEAAFLLCETEPLPFANVFGDTAASHRYRDLKDAVTVGKLKSYESRTQKVGGTLVRPADCVIWALERQDDVPEALRDLVRRVEQDKPLHPKERETLLKLVIGMAIKGFDFNPEALRSDVPGEIAAALEGLGIGLDADTVRKWLREGVRLLPAKAAGGVR